MNKSVDLELFQRHTFYASYDKDIYLPVQFEFAVHVLILKDIVDMDSRLVSKMQIFKYSKCFQQLGVLSTNQIIQFDARLDLNDNKGLNKIIGINDLFDLKNPTNVSCWINTISNPTIFE